MANRINWVNVLFFSLTFLGAATLTPLYLYYYGWNWGLFALFVVTYFATAMSITAGYHRFLAHRSYSAKSGVKLAYLLVGAAAFQGSALQWCTDHRRHHRNVDTDRDPHNIKKGFLWAHIGWILYKEDGKDVTDYPPDLLNDKLIMWQHNHYVWIATAVSAGVPLLVGALMGHPIGGFIFGALLRVVCCNHSTFFINSLAHTLGSRPYNTEQTARDSFIMAILACGEGYHNYHHQFASDYRNGIRWYQWDPTKWLIGAMAVPGWTYRLKRIPQTEVLRARLRVEQIRLVAGGAPADRVAALTQKVEEAQKRWRALCDEYQRRKALMRDRSHQHVLQVKAELKAARLEFKRAWAQWKNSRKAYRVRVRTWPAA